MNQRKVLAFILIGFTFLLIYGSVLLSPFSSPADIHLTPIMLMLALCFNMLIFTGVSILGNTLLYNITIRESFRHLSFSRKKIIHSLVSGALLAFFAIIILSIIFALLQYRGISIPENPLGEDIAESITFPLLFLVPLFSSVSEEVFFRGFLQPKIIKHTTLPQGIIITSLLFGIAHFSYGNSLQVLIPFILGLGFGFLLVKTKNIIAPISAHFTFNFIQLILVYSF